MDRQQRIDELMAMTTEQLHDEFLRQVGETKDQIVLVLHTSGIPTNQIAGLALCELAVHVLATAKPPEALPPAAIRQGIAALPILYDVLRGDKTVEQGVAEMKGKGL